MTICGALGYVTGNRWFQSGDDLVHDVDTVMILTEFLLFCQVWTMGQCRMVP